MGVLDRRRARAECPPEHGLLLGIAEGAASCPEMGIPVRTQTAAVIMRTSGRLLAGTVAAVLLCGAPAAAFATAPTSAATAPSPRISSPGVAALPIVTRAATAPLDGPDVSLWLEGMLPGMLEREAIPGAVVSVVAGGAVIAQGDYGSARREDAPGETNRLDASASVVRVGGVSAVLTGIAVMQLVEDGSLDLDAPIKGYLDFPIETRFPDPITLRHLLSHTAGFEGRLSVRPSSQKDLPTLKEWVSSEQPHQVYAPGTTPAYSSYGIDLAGYIVEKAAGVPFSAYMDEKVLLPIGMGDSSFAQPLPSDRTEWVAPTYSGASGAPLGFELQSGAPSSALSATAIGMARLLLFAGGGIPEASSVLSVESRALMLQPALGVEQLGGLASAPVMGIAWQDESRNGHRIYGHNGDLDGSHSALQLYSSSGAGIFISLTGGGKNADSSQFIRTAVMNAFADRYFPLVPAAPDAPQVVAVEPAADEAAADASTPRIAPIAGVIGATTSTGAEHAAIAAGNYELSRTVRSNFGQLFALSEQVQLSTARDGMLKATLPVGVAGVGGEVIYHEIQPWLWQEVNGQHLMAMRLEGGVVQAISIAPTLTLLPVEQLAAASIAIPLLLAALAVLIITLVCWPIAAILRNRHDVEWPLSGPSRAARVLLILAAIAAIGSAAGWVYGLPFILGNEIGIRALQVLTVAGVAGVIPALWNLVQGIRKRRGFGSVFWALLLVAAFAVLAYYAWVTHLLSLNIAL